MMVFKEYKNKRIQAATYYNLFHTLQSVYKNELDETLVYPQDIFNKEYENGRILLIFCEDYLLKVTFDENNVELKPLKYSDIQFSFISKESRYPEEYEPSTLVIDTGVGELYLNPLKDFSSSVAMNYLNLTIDIYRLLLKK